MSTSLDAVRRILLERRDELKKRVSKITDDVRHVSGPLSSDFAEQAVERENEEVLDALGEAGRQELRQISAALARIDNGEYGTCVGCGEQIPWPRLEVLPFSDQCVSCAEDAPRQG
ncbi:MAG: TraR/DksA C4-type zinc finger protein [Gammaproteobacteria bacterium]|nr:TraR/DksA C4-type zinc finger protein [Gammaproteobacteria bacterium]NND59859.1 TraR/DksA family transcriptional regulator [Gammaproteobacteria bacterium]